MLVIQRMKALLDGLYACGHSVIVPLFMDSNQWSFEDKKQSMKRSWPECDLV